MKRGAELAVSLLCRGVRIDPSCDIEKDGRALFKRRAGLGSGLEIVLLGRKKIWINVPVEEGFAQNSPYLLIKRDGAYLLEDGSSSEKIQLPPAAPWYRRKTDSGVRMSRIGVLQGTYLGIYVGKRCAFWRQTPSMACRFCATGINVGVHEESEKSATDVVEVARAAKKSGVTFVHLNSGYQQENDLDIIYPYVKALKEQVGILVGVQCIPPKNVKEYRPLLDLGVDHFSLCYELHGMESFDHYLPGKAKYIGQRRFFHALEYLAGRMHRGSVSGEIIAGLEPVENTLKAIDYITSLGAFPTVCVFRPLKGCALESRPSPDEEEMLTIFKYVASKCLEHKIPIGVVPNLEVSLVMTPDDARYLLVRNFSWYLHHWRLKLIKTLARAYFAWKSKRQRFHRDNS